jgi:hypothetical protein
MMFFGVSKIKLTEDLMPICEGCGGSFDDESKFCAYCGRSKPDRMYIINQNGNNPTGVNKATSELAIQRLEKEIAKLKYFVLIGISGHGLDLAEKLMKVRGLEWDLEGYIEIKTGKKRRIFGGTLNTSLIRDLLVADPGDWTKELKSLSVLNVKDIQEYFIELNNRCSRDKDKERYDAAILILHDALEAQIKLEEKQGELKRHQAIVNSI